MSAIEQLHQQQQNQTPQHPTMEEQSTAELLQNLGVDKYNNNNNNKNHHSRRRNSVGRAAASAGMILTRTASLPRLLNKSFNNSVTSFGNHGVWGQESASTLDTLNASLLSLEEDYMAAHELLVELDQAIGKLALRKTKLQQRIDNTLELACARYEGDCRHGALLSMRKAYGMKTRLAYVAAARFQLVELHGRIQIELEPPTMADRARLDLDVPELRRCIIAMLTQMNTAPCPVPPNDALWSHLYKLLDLVEI